MDVDVVDTGGGSDGSDRLETASDAPESGFETETEIGFETEPESEVEIGLESGSKAAQLLAALEGADDLPLDERLELLRRAESSIAGVLEGLDGL